jgi:hypothetical protein
MHQDKGPTTMIRLIPATLLALVLASPLASAQDEPASPPAVEEAAPAVELPTEAPATEALEEAPADEPSKADELITKASAEPVTVALELYKAAKGGNWRYASALMLVLLMFGWNKARKSEWLKEKVDLSGDRAGAISVLALGLAGGVLTALVADAPLDFALFAGAIWTAVSGAGVFLVVKKIIFPGDA